MKRGKRDRAAKAVRFADRIRRALDGDAEKIALFCDMLDQRTRYRMRYRDWESLLASGQAVLR